MDTEESNLIKLEHERRFISTAPEEVSHGRRYMADKRLDTSDQFTVELTENQIGLILMALSQADEMFQVELGKGSESIAKLKFQLRRVLDPVSVL